MKEKSERDTFLESLDTEIHELHKKETLASWNLYFGGSLEDVDNTSGDISRFYWNEDYFRTLKEMEGKEHDPFHEKWIEQFMKAFLVGRINFEPEIFRLRNRLEKRLIAFRPVLKGEQQDRAVLHERLVKEEDRNLRKEITLSLWDVHRTMRDDLMTLVRMRNDAARQAGYEDYAALLLETQDLSKEEMKTLCEKIKVETEDTFQELLQTVGEAVGTDRPEPWDIGFATHGIKWLPDKFFPRTELIASGMKLAEELGFGEEARKVKVVTEDIPFGGICYPVDPPSDVRILINPRDGQFHYYVFFHELGHAIHARSLNEDLPHLLRYEDSSGMVEGIADTIGAFALEREWLDKISGLDDAVIDRFLSNKRIITVESLRGLAKLTCFEMELYERPEDDLDSLYDELASKFTISPSEQIPRFASQTLFTTHPLYEQNYILAHIISQQFVDFLKREGKGRILGMIGVGDLMKNEIFHEGALKGWKEKVKRFTGEEYNPDHLLETLR